MLVSRRPRLAAGRTILVLVPPRWKPIRHRNLANPGQLGTKLVYDRVVGDYSGLTKLTMVRIFATMDRGTSASGLYRVLEMSLANHNPFTMGGTV